MKLFYSKTSPYSRKVRLVIIEKGLEDQVEMVLCNPHEGNLALEKANPLGKIPTLILNDGEALYDSPVICEYLDTLSANVPLIPENEQRWGVLRWQALADGMTDAAYNIVMENNRPAGEISSKCISDWSIEINRSLQEIETTIPTLLPTLDSSINLAHLSVATVLGYLDFRLPDMLWENKLPNTHKWYEKFRTRKVMLVTEPE